MKIALAVGAAIAALAITPASATVLVAGAQNLTFSAFDTSTRGTQVGTTVVQSGSSPTIQGDLTSAVFLNTLGGLDFYFQVSRTNGTGTNMIDGLNVGDFTGYTIDALADGSDFDGTTGAFKAVNNPPSSTTTVSRSAGGGVVQIDFGLNGLADTENSTIYILRTNARMANLNGFATVRNSTAFNLRSAQPTGAVPEPSTWAMMLVGFGLVGAVSRYRRKDVRVTYA